MKRFPLVCLCFLFVLLLSACGTNSSVTSTTTTSASSSRTTPLVMANGHFSEYALPQTGSGLMRPAIDQQGRIWFGEMAKNYLAVFDPRTHSFQQMTPPRGAYGIMGIVAAPDGSIWFTEQYANYIGRYNPVSQRYTLYDLPMQKIPDPSNSKNSLPLPAAPNDLALDGHGNIWFTEMNIDSLGMLDVQSGQITQYPLSANKSVQKLNPYGMTVDAAGKVWFTEASTNRLGCLDPQTKQITHYAMGDSSSPLMELVSDTQGNIWATAFNVGLLVMFNPRTKAFTPYYAPATTGNAGGLYGITITTNDEIWVTVSTENSIARLDTKANRFVYYQLPTTSSLPLGIIAHGQQLWFTEAGTNKLGMLEP